MSDNCKTHTQHRKSTLNTQNSTRTRTLVPRPPTPELSLDTRPSILDTRHSTLHRGITHAAPIHEIAHPAASENLSAHAVRLRCDRRAAGRVARLRSGLHRRLRERRLDGDYRAAPHHD